MWIWGLGLEDRRKVWNPKECEGTESQEECAIRERKMAKRGRKDIKKERNRIRRIRFFVISHKSSKSMGLWRVSWVTE